MAVPVLFKINNKHLIEIMLSSSELQVYETKLSKTFANWSDDEILQCSIEAGVQPTEVKNTAEQYSRNTERSANYVLKEVTIVNCKAKPEFTWSLLRAEYVKRLLQELKFHYVYEIEGEIIPEKATPISITYWDFIGIRTIDTYMGQTIEGTLVQYEKYASSTWNDSTKEWETNTDVLNPGKTLYWENFRIAFPER